jgi:hypothetical protein
MKADTRNNARITTPYPPERLSKFRKLGVRKSEALPSSFILAAGLAGISYELHAPRQQPGKLLQLKDQEEEGKKT